MTSASQSLSASSSDKVFQTRTPEREKSFEETKQVPKSRLYTEKALVKIRPQLEQSFDATMTKPKLQMPKLNLTGESKQITQIQAEEKKKV